LNHILSLSDGKRRILREIFSRVDQNHIEKINSILPNGMRQKNIKDNVKKVPE